MSGVIEEAPQQNSNSGRVGLMEIFGVFLWIGTISFGGGAVGYLRQSLVLGACYAVLSQNSAVLSSPHGVAAAATGFLFAVAVQTGREQLSHLQPLIFVVLTFIATSILRLPLVVVLFVRRGFSIWLHRPRTSSTDGAASSEEDSQ